MTEPQKSDSPEIPVTYRVSERYIKPEEMNDYWKEVMKKPRDGWLKGHGQNMLGYTFINGKGEVAPIFNHIEIDSGKELDGTDVKIRNYHTTKEGLEYYNANYRAAVVRSSNDAFPGMNDKDHLENKNCPVKFDFETHSENSDPKATEHFYAMAENKNDKPLKLISIYSKRSDTPLSYRVRVEIADPSKLERPYEQWIKEHAEQMTGLKYGGGNESLFSAVEVRKAMEGYKAIYIIDYETTNGKFANYLSNDADRMRSVFADTYKDPSLFAFKRATLSKGGASHTERAEFADLEKGEKGVSLGFFVITSQGASHSRGV